MMTKSDKEIFQQTGEDLISLLDREEPVSPEDIDVYGKEIVRMAIRIKRKKRIYHLAYSAAAVVCLALLSTFIYDRFSSLTPEEDLVVFDSESQGDTKEVVLLTEGQNVVLENETQVEYNEDGKAVVKGQMISAAPAAPTVEKKTKKNLLNRITVPNGKRSYLVLTDGTRLSINSGSRVAYPAVFDDDKREIFVQGEVYLQVAKDAQRPFYVKTGKFDVKVLGTSFNVSAYNDVAESSIVLVEGSVEMISNKKETVKIEPGQKLSIGNDGLSITEVDVNEYILWKDNILYLGNYKSCGEILTRLARQYDVVIEYDDRIKNMYIGGKLDVCECIEDALDILSVMAKFTYERRDNKIIIQSKKIH